METTKTTINLPSELFHKARVTAVKNKITLTQLLITALEQLLSQSTLSTLPRKKSLVQFLKNNPSPFKSMSDQESEKRYRAEMMRKHG